MKRKKSGWRGMRRRKDGLKKEKARRFEQTMKKITNEISALLTNQKSDES